jgi:hypothetical protein
LLSFQIAPSNHVRIHSLGTNCNVKKIEAQHASITMDETVTQAGRFLAIFFTSTSATAQPQGRAREGQG